jgi:signal transduction histidine kinase
MTLQIFDIPDSLSGSITKHLYRIVQSALGNIEKYAKATSVDIQFFYYNNELVLAIEDNGIGFLYSKENPVMSITEMQSRVESLGGVMEISSSKKRGTSIMITVPI